MKRTRKQSAYAAQELPSATQMIRTGSAAWSIPSFCEIKGFTEQKEGIDRAVLPAPDPPSSNHEKKRGRLAAP